ncbi:hypothetical protein [Pseudonocardia sp. T1-2H]|uniref:hypothetical protein n=1 Tax=Pseudonocardia sp. T1-2H TaxID=3128899 RepID=UPI0031013851
MVLTKTIGRAAAVAGAVAGGLAARRSRTRHDGTDVRRWFVVTVNRSPEDVMPDGKLPEPLARLGDAIEVRIRPAPGDKGTELAARLTHPPGSGPAAAKARLHGEDPRQQVRTALRQAKAILEVGEVVLPDAPGTTHPGLGGRLVAVADRVAQGEGRL